MTWLIGLAVCLVVFGALMWGARKAGKDAVKDGKIPPLKDPVMEAVPEEKPK